MPLTVVWYKPEKVDNKLLNDLTEKLPKIVAKALDVPENLAYRLAEEEIEVVTEELSGKYDRNTLDLEIIIWAPECSERLKTKGERRNKICRSVEAVLVENLKGPEHIKGYVWLLLQPTSFGMLFGLEAVGNF